MSSDGDIIVLVLQSLFASLDPIEIFRLILELKKGRLRSADLAINLLIETSLPISL